MSGGNTLRRDAVAPTFMTGAGITHDAVDLLSEYKGEPEWMRDFRHRSLDIFLKKPIPKWGGDLTRLDFRSITPYLKPAGQQGRPWSDVSDRIKRAFGLPARDNPARTQFAGVGAQHESEVVYHSLAEEWTERGVIFLDTESALREHPELVQRYWATIVPPEDNKFSALNSAFWSGGFFVYIPRGVNVTVPLQAYFLIDGRDSGQFARTLVIIEENASLHYAESCTASTTASHALHSAIAEVMVHRGGHCRYSTMQTWPGSVFNLTTKRAVAEADARMEWVDGNLGSQLTMTYPAVHMQGPRARGEVFAVAYAGDGQHQDAGAKLVFNAPDCSGHIHSRSICQGSGRTTYRGLVKVFEGATNSNCTVQCDALLMNPEARSDLYPFMEIEEKRSSISHQASVAEVGEEQLFYLQSRGLSRARATAMIVRGFVEPIGRTLPPSFAEELTRLIETEVEATIG